MESYKGFMIDQTAVQAEVTSYDGKAEAGIGIYSTTWVTRLIDPRTAKSMTVPSVDEAKRLVDKWFTGDGIAELENLQKTIANEQTSFERYEIKANKDLAEIGKKLALERQNLYDLKSKLPPTFN